MSPAERIVAADRHLTALNRLLEQLWAERVDMRERLYDAMRDLRMVKLTLSEAVTEGDEHAP